MDKQNRITVVNKIEKYLLMYVILWSATPYLQLNVTPLLIIACVLMFTVIKLISTGTVSKQQFFMLAYFIFILIYRVIGVSTAAWGNYYMLFITFWYIFPLQYYMEHMPLQEKKFIINYTFIVILANGVYNLLLNFWHRGISAEINFTTKFNKYNVWGTDYIQNVVLLVGVWFICCFICYKKRKVLSYASWYLIFVCMCIYMLVTARTTSILLFALMFVFLYFLFMKNKKIRLLEMCLLTFIAILTLFFMKDVMLLMARLTSFNAHVSDAFMALAHAGADNFTDESSLSIRFNLYLMSINTFMNSWKNVLLGVGYHSMENTLEYGIGNHSQIVDDIARYGLGGGLLMVTFCISYIGYLRKKIVYKMEDKRAVYALYGAYALLLVMSILNNAYKPMTGLVMLFIYPLLINIKGETASEINQGNIEKDCSFK